MTEQDDLPRDPALSRRYREATDVTPPSELDASILAAGRAAVQPPPRPARPWWQLLSLPVGIAATTLLAVMLSLTVQRQAPESLERSEIMAPAVVPAPAESMRKIHPAPTASRTDGALSAPAVHAERLSQTVEKKVVAEPAAQAAMSASSASPPATPARSEEAAAVPPRLKVEAAADRAQEAEARTPPQNVAPSPAAAAARLGGAKGEEAMPAQTWLEEIRELKRQGREEEAVRHLVEFRKAYPGYVLPEDLR